MLFELSKEVEVDDVLLHLMENCPNYLSNKALLAKVADYLAENGKVLKARRLLDLMWKQAVRVYLRKP